MCLLLTEYHFCTLKAKRHVTDTEEYKKVLDRPFVAPSLSGRAGATDEGSYKLTTSHYDYNFDEKDYKSKLNPSPNQRDILFCFYVNVR